ncbi:hypothetical protein LPB41_06785 [Thalassospira sp. MA62]|nr:hypothetical protein [Thalassospira sp. MA62]
MRIFGKSQQDNNVEKDEEHTVILVEVNELRPSEKCNEGRSRSLHRKIQAEGIWNYPILIEDGTGIIMDGHHRFAVAKSMALSYVPCVKLSYESPALKVYSWSNNKPFDIAKIREAALQGELLEFKTTRHLLSGKLGACHFPLVDLF